MAHLALRDRVACGAMSGSEVVELGGNSASVGTLRGVDAVVYIHGIGGHYRDTWGAFPNLLATDPALPDLDVLLWGYRTALGPRDVPDTETVARNLVSELDVRLQPGVAACLVGHSMGGLIVFQALVEEMAQGRAEEHPTKAIRQLTLFAVPVTGSSLAGKAKEVVESLGLPRLANKQVRSLDGEVCETLLGEVAARIYDPSDEGPDARRIPIRLVVASRDAVVDEADRSTTRPPFREPRPLELDFDHRDVKLPSTRLDVRYLALVRDVHAMVTGRFIEASRQVLDAADEERRRAEADLEISYGRLLRRPFAKAGGDPDAQPLLYADYRLMVLRDCVCRGGPPLDAARRAVVVLTDAGYFGRGE